MGEKRRVGLSASMKGGRIEPATRVFGLYSCVRGGRELSIVGAGSDFGLDLWVNGMEDGSLACLCPDSFLEIGF